jgi:DNA-binding transcriptional LysR family regulator
MRRVLVGSPRYVGAQRPARTPRDPESWECVQLSSRPAQLTLTSSGKKTVSVALKPRISVDSAGAMRELVMAGAGIATLPEVTVRSEIARGRLVEVLPDWHTDLLGVYVIWPNNAPRTGLTLRFIDFMASRVAELFAPPSG